MSVKVMSYVWDRAPKDMSAGDMLVALTLADHADREGGSAFPSLADMARATHLSERQVRRVLRRLETFGLIAVQKPATRRLPTMYCFPGFRGDIGVPPQDDVRGDIRVPPEMDEGGHLRQSGGTFATVRGDICDTHIYKELEPSVEPSVEPSDIPASRAKQGYSQEFEAFWKAYPRTNGAKLDAWAAWKTLNGDERAAAVAGLAKWLASEHWRDGYVRYAERYLRKRMWEDDPAPKVQSNGHDSDGAMLALLEVNNYVAYYQAHGMYPEEPLPGVIVDAVKAAGGWEGWTNSGYQRRDFLRAYGELKGART